MAIPLSKNINVPITEKKQLRFLTCGSVDDGKSTLIGRMLYDSQSVMDDQISQSQTESDRYGTQGKELDLALLVDGLQAEREQGITIDVAYRFFETRSRKFIAVDTPGHEQYTRNMVTGASNVDLAIILIDAQKGISTQTKRHSAIIHLLGIKKVVLAINKMDLIDFDQKGFLSIKNEYESYAKKLVELECIAIPISALTGDGVTKISKHMGWYSGPTILSYLEKVDVFNDILSKPARLPIQWVNRPNSSFRGFSGLLHSGSMSVGDEVTIFPSSQRSKIVKIFEPNGEVQVTQAGKSITLTLKNEVDVSRGDMIANDIDAPHVADKLSAHIVWMDKTSLLPERTYDIRFATSETKAQIISLEHKIDIDSLSKHAAKTLSMNEIGYCKLSLSCPIAFDSYIKNKFTGSFILIDRESKATAGAGIIDYPLRRSSNIRWHNMEINKKSRAQNFKQHPLILWFTGLSGSGKSSIADQLEQALVDRGHSTYLLDGDNVRHGLNKDLGFTDQDRVENIRRVAEVGNLMVDAGLIVLACFISPFRAERSMARALFEDDEFIEIFVDTPIETCEKRDPKGLYKKARSGQLNNFTGLDSPYETPNSPEIHLQTKNDEINIAVRQILSYLEGKI